MKSVLILGATSAIARETAKIFAGDGDRLYLVGRSEERLRAVAEDLIVRGAARVEIRAVDLNRFGEHTGIIDDAENALGGLDTVLVAHGTLGDQKACEEDFSAAEREIRTNFLSVVSLLTIVANRFESRGRGCIAVIASVAGDRGRRSNYVYGTAKGAVSLFLQGLRNRLDRKGVHVLTVKPGFVDTPMTASFEKGPLFSSPDIIAQGICRAIAKKKEEVYLPFYWKYIMAVVKWIPERYFKRLDL